MTEFGALILSATTPRLKYYSKIHIGGDDVLNIKWSPALKFLDVAFTTVSNENVLLERGPLVMSSLLSFVIICRWGRRPSMGLFFVVSGLTSIATAFIPMKTGEFLL